MSPLPVGAAPSKTYRGLEGALFVPFVLGGVAALDVVDLGHCADSIGGSVLCGFGVVAAGLAVFLAAGLWVIVGTAAQLEASTVVFRDGAVVLRDGSPALEDGSLVVATAALAAVAVYPIALYLDARGVRDRTDEWDPSPLRYAAVGALFTGPVLFNYLWKRHGYVAEPVDSGRWWILAVCGLGITALGHLLAVFVHPALFGVVLVGVVTVAVGVYRDASFVSDRRGWQPNPASQAVCAFVSALVTPVLFGYGLYYGRRRARLAEPD